MNKYLEDMWSKIQMTELETEVYMIITTNEINGCEYHNNSHVHNMYSFLEENEVQYDPVLDWAILFHDAVYDSEPDKEVRSAQLFGDMVNQYRGCTLDTVERQRVYDLILCTKDHSLKGPIIKGQKEIIFADLNGLTDKKTVVQNFVKIMNESVKLYGIEDLGDFAKANIQFMTGLRKRTVENLGYLEEEKDINFIKSVIEGIDTTVKLASALVDN